MYWVIKHIRNSKFSSTIMFLGFFISMIALSIGTSMIMQINKLTDDHSNGKFKYVKNINISFKNEYSINDLTEILKKHFVNSDVLVEFIPVETENHEIIMVTGVLPKDKYLWLPPMINGKFLDSSSNERVAVVGKNITNGIEGDELSIGRKKYKITGTCGKREDSALNREVFIPISYIPEIVNNINNTFDFVVKTNKNPQIDIDNFKNDLNVKYPNTVIKIDNDKRIAKERSSFVRMFIISLKDLSKLWLIAIFNIINISYFWIHTRRKELALRKTFGASKLSLYILILKEILFICLFANIAAVLLLIVLNRFSIQLFAYEFDLSFSIILISIFISLFTSVLTAIIPANFALKVQSAEVLKE